MRKYKREFNVYRVVNDIDDMVYIGSTTTELWHRMSQHRAEARRGVSAPLYDLMRRYGIEHFKIELICRSGPERLRADEQSAIGGVPGGRRLNYKRTCINDTSVHYDYDEICRAYAQTKSQSAAANIIGCSRVTVRKALRSRAVPIEYPPHTPKRHKKGLA